MSLRSSLRLLLVIGLGAVAGAVLPAPLCAQVPVRRDTVSGRRDTLPTRVDSTRAGTPRAPAGRDTIRVPLPPRADTIVRNDSARRGGATAKKIPTDTIKPPLARAEAPPILEIGAPRIFDRTALFATGAVSLSDLLGRVPGVTEFTTGWIGAPYAIASQGDLRRIRIFLDGIELDPMDPRGRGVAAPNDLPIHALEEVRIERGAEEVRVYARSWRVDRTTPYTRADVATGDQNTNLYRAFFGRRFKHGEVFQLSADQYNTQPDRALPSSDALNLMLRVGTTHGPWSADLFAERSSRNRAPWVGAGPSQDRLDTIPGFDARRTTAYARIANGDPDRGRWIQLVASAHSYDLAPRASNAFLPDANPSAGDSGTVTPDTNTFVSQYLVTGGITRGPFRVSAAERVRTSLGLRKVSPSARASFDSRQLGVSLFTEGESPLQPTRYEGTVRLSPLSRVALVGTASHTALGYFVRLFPQGVSGSVIDSNAVFIPGTMTGTDSGEVSGYVLAPTTHLRAEAGVRLGDLWLSVGMLRRGATTLLPPSELIPRDSLAGSAVRVEGAATARTLALRGRLYRAINADAWAVAWSDSTGLYRPRYQTRSELFIQTNLLDRFPRGNFGLLTSLAHEYRSSTRFPLKDESVLRVNDSRTLSFKLEIRIQTAVVSYQFRNVLQERYSYVPGFTMPRQTQFYGVRWDFWN
ncbi:MAG TPA: Plug domain-containing protein [Gemmatimonadaceae bacterium]|nr:Plug domain-containing protein [Gemmatimonadaceae bacterium]